MLFSTVTSNSRFLILCALRGFVDGGLSIHLLIAHSLSPLIEIAKPSRVSRFGMPQPSWFETLPFSAFPHLFFITRFDAVPARIPPPPTPTDLEQSCWTCLHKRERGSFFLSRSASSCGRRRQRRTALSGRPTFGRSRMSTLTTRTWRKGTFGSSTAHLFFPTK